MMAPAGRRRVVAAMVAAAAVALLAGGADADCFDYCYKNCVANDKSMADYCNYACDKTCAPGPLAGVTGAFPIRCQIDCVRKSCTGLRQDRKGIVACYRGCFHGCKTKTGPRPLRASAGEDTGSALVSETNRGDAVRPTSDHPFHEKQDAIDPDHP